MNTIKIEMYSDYACPFCYIGQGYLEQALAQFEHADDVEIVHKAYELYPDMTNEVTSTTQGRIEWKYRKTPEGAIEMIRHIEGLAQRAGINMDYEHMQNTNTFEAHRLTKFAESKGKGAEMYARLMKAYFTDNLPLAKRENLVQLATEIGLDKAEVETFLDSDLFADAVRGDENQAKQIGVQAVPFFMVNGEIPVAGSQPPAQFLALLKQVYQENNAQFAEGASCGIDGCH
ncbi:DsbA family oxidoreductase [Neisseria iguanae]|uniref:DsbA family oxidoreductase n=1 Tax=Neisseria iguanae TaxID=90242 RepID=A0A2P7U0C7_9NEIS|nr:DsbA family oxidoreductase [Neisseria iguanae]PSJ80424.1 DsbA family oxidoreductase [Neisseria iguanae]